MTMALVVIMIVLIGVMGAGLLTFVSRDLESVIEVNRGQLAQEAADAGVEAARRHLATTDALPGSYDDANTADNSAWYADVSPKQITFKESNDVRVGIRYLFPAASDAQARQEGFAPEVLISGADYPNNRNYFSVTVRGTSGNAIRQVQVIYSTENFDLPVAYYATRDIDFNGAATNVSGLSLFANRYIYDLRPSRITGNDNRYGDWATNPTTGQPNAFNSVPRTNSVGTPVIAAGAAALGTGTNGTPACPLTQESGIVYDPTNTNNLQKAGTAGASQRYRFRDYDRHSDYRCNGSTAESSGRPDFRANTWGALSNQPSSAITFPFATNSAEATAADDELIAELKQKAQNQGLYVRRDPGTSFTIDDNGGDLPRYPADSDLTETVMFIEFANADGSSGTKGDVEYRAGSSDADNLVKGTIVVVNGDLDTNPSADDFQGVMVIRDPNDTDNGSDTTSIGCNDNGTVMDFCNSGSLNIEGYVNIEGDMSLGGSIDGFLPAPLVNGVPGLFRVSQWSWRECYNTTCG